VRSDYYPASGSGFFISPLHLTAKGDTTLKKKSLREIYKQQPKLAKAIADSRKILSRSTPIPRHHIERALLELEAMSQGAAS